jgi:hypothetical protein
MISRTLFCVISAGFPIAGNNPGLTSGLDTSHPRRRVGFGDVERVEINEVFATSAIVVAREAWILGTSSAWKRGQQGGTGAMLTKNLAAGDLGSDNAAGRFMNRNFAEYHLRMNADLIRRQRHGRDRDRGNRGGDRPCGL